MREVGPLHGQGERCPASGARSGTAAKGEKGSVVSPKTQWLPALRFSHFRVQLETNTRVRPTAGLMLMAAKATAALAKRLFP